MNKKLNKRQKLSAISLAVLAVGISTYGLVSSHKKAATEQLKLKQTYTFTSASDYSENNSITLLLPNGEPMAAHCDWTDNKTHAEFNFYNLDGTSLAVIYDKKTNAPYSFIRDDRIDTTARNNRVVNDSVSVVALDEFMTQYKSLIELKSSGPLDSIKNTELQKQIASIFDSIHQLGNEAVNDSKTKVGSIYDIK